MTTKHILVVEDEEKIASLLCDYMEAAGFRTSSQASGDRVIARIKKNMPDLKICGSPGRLPSRPCPAT